MHIKAYFQAPSRETNLLRYECGKKKAVLSSALTIGAGQFGHGLIAGLTQSHYLE